MTHLCGKITFIQFYTTCKDIFIISFTHGLAKFVNHMPNKMITIISQLTLDFLCTIGRLELRRARRALPLHLAPPRLLAWCWSDYRALARPGAGNGGGDGAGENPEAPGVPDPDPGAGDGADAGPGGAVGADTAGDGAGS